MATPFNRRTFMQQTLLSSAGALAVPMAASAAQVKVTPTLIEKDVFGSKASLPTGTIGKLKVSRLLLGGNLLTHFTHSRDLQYVYSLAARYNTPEKILETLAIAEEHGINTLVIHTVPWALDVLQQHRKRGGRMQWIICSTAEVDDKMEAYKRSVQEMIDMGVDAIYVWGVRADALASQGRVDLIARAVEAAKQQGVPSGVGAHDINVIIQSEQNQVNADFYIKTLHHHKYPTGPRPEEIRDAIAEIPGYWCNDPAMVIDVMKDVARPWIAFKVMAAGAIPPADAFRYAFVNGADHVLAGMFDFEIAQDVQIANQTLAGVSRPRPWYS
ncbi:MAG: hypothetical protein JW828_03110 [Sedimentisphaerales bacterium]|nr:hypothetical protein [Sedimentisphaerales bacterium]